MDFLSLGWLSNLFLFLASFIFPRAFSSDFDILRIIYSSSAFSKYAVLFASKPKLLFLKYFFIFLFAY